MTSAPASTETAAAAQADEIHLSRVFPTPRETVFHAWIDPRQLADWWGRHDFTNPVCEFDARPGGRFRIVMCSAEGVDYPLHGVIRAIEPPRRLALSFDLSAYPQAWRDFLCADLRAADAALVNEHHLDLALSEASEGTLLELCLRFPSSALRGAFLRGGLIDDWNEGLDSLAALLTRST